MRTASVAILATCIGVVSCGTQSEGPPPRYAEAPPEQNAAPGQEGEASPPAPNEADAGAVTPPATDSGTGGVLVAAPPAAGPLNAAGPLTQEQWDAMLVTGRRKYNGLCGGCHGTGIGPTLNGRHRTAERVRRQIRMGGGDMRPISERRLSNDDLEALIVFLTTIRTVTDIQPPR